MNVFKRRSIGLLEQWRGKKGRKPLILRGARQVGKTTLVKDFGKCYKQFVLLNLELANDRRLFSNDLDVSALLQRISLRENLAPDWENTLLFIDEIQELPEAIQILRYFYESYPKLSVIAAGSLLEFALTEVKSFPVGRVEFQYLHPLCFEEFLQAIGKYKALELYHTLPIPEFALDELHKLYQVFCLLGGMPEVVARYAEDHTFFHTPEIYESIWQTYLSDVAKYASKENDKRRIQHIMKVAPAYYDKRITFQHFGQSAYKSREMGEAFRQLNDAGIIRLVYPTTQMVIPLIPDFHRSPRIQFLDTGLLVHQLGVISELIGVSDLSDSARGTLIPHSIFQERIAIQTHTNELPIFWVREKTQSSAEIDLLIKIGSRVIPVEIKSGSIGKLRSLHSFIEVSDYTLAIRLYRGKPMIDEVKLPSGKKYSLLSLPYFLAAKLDDYIEQMLLPWENNFIH
jgi:uncharacterized protein